MSDPINEAWKRFLVTEGLDEACNRYFDPDTGHFTSKEEAAKKGGTYSISKAASDRCGDVVAKPGKMKVTGKGKLQTKFTLAQCGRKNAQTSLQQIIRELEATQEPLWSPVILNGGGFGMLANHSLVMANYLSRANAALIDLRRLLEQG